MSDIIVGVNQIAEKNVQMIGICLQQLVFTTHNILEMSKIRQGRFKQNTKPVNISEKLDCIFDFLNGTTLIAFGLLVATAFSNRFLHLALQSKLSIAIAGAVGLIFVCGEFLGELPDE
jgi:hypothetical protein